MPISFTPIGQDGCWMGCAWSIDDEDELARLIARVALGQSRYVERILQQTDCADLAPVASAFEGARNLLSVPPGKDPYQRDGWMFQVMSWVAAHRQDDGALIRSPHMNHAHKGFDGIHVQVDHNTDKVLSVIICEEKATEHPRNMISSDVWPEFETLETGKRDNELVAEVTAMLDRAAQIDPDQAAAQIFWKEARAYRISITVGDAHADEAGRERLFEGYDEKVDGSVDRRRSETLHLQDLRAWMNDIAQRALGDLEEMEAACV